MAARGRTERPAVLGKITSARTLMLSPFVPHVAEEMWEKLGNKTRASKSSWPEAKDVQLGYDEMREDLFRRILDDISKILKVTKMSPKSITVYTAGAMKSDSYAYIVREVLAGSSNMGQIMPKLLSNPATQDIKKSPDYVQKSIKDVLSETEEVRKYLAEDGMPDEKKIFSEMLADLVREQFGAQLHVYSEDDGAEHDPKGKARHSRPLKPAILLE